MANLENERRHNPTRTEVPTTFVDLGKLFDEDSRREYMSSSRERGVPNSHVVPEEIEDGCLQSEAAGNFDEDFMIG